MPETADIILVQPPFDFSRINSEEGRKSRRGGYYLYYPPLGFCSMAATLKSAGHDVGIIDGLADAGDEQATIDLVCAARPKLLGVSVPTPSLPVAFRLIEAVRSRLNIPIVVGGPHVSCDPEIINSIGADFGVVGDGEEPMLRIADHVLRGTPLDPTATGIITPGAASVQPTQSDLDRLPVPLRSILRTPSAYFNPFAPLRTTTMLSARGCPFLCSFCCRTISMGAYRPLSVERAVEEMLQISAEGYKFVSLFDETFTFDRERAINLARAMRSRNIKFQWSCQTRADLIDEESLKELKQAGCINISFGVEAGNETVRNDLDKKISDKSFEHAFSICRKAGVTTNAFMLIGSPDETRQDIERTISRAVELAPDYVVFNIGTLLPGSREYDQRLADGRISRNIWDRCMRGEADMPVLSENISKAELADLLRTGYSRFYMRPAYMLKKLGSIRSVNDVAILARQARTVISDYVFS